ncbi:hypothetical protein RJZ90_001190 [Blastomyces dermatitidis]
MDFLHGKERMIKAASAIRLQGIETVQPTRPHASLHGKVSAAPLGLQHCNAPSPKDGSPSGQRLFLTENWDSTSGNDQSNSAKVDVSIRKLNVSDKLHPTSPFQPIRIVYGIDFEIIAKSWRQYVR